jgi:hypothetical protein
MIRIPVVPWPWPMNRKIASAAQGNHPPRCAQAPAEAYARPAGSGNRLPVLDSEAPKLPIHTAIAVPQYGTQGSVGHRRRCQFGGSASADMDPSHAGIKQRPQTRRQNHSSAQCPRTTFLCWSTGSPVPPIARSRRKPPAGAAIVRPYAAAWASAPASAAANASASFWWPASLGCRQSVPPTRSPGPSSP